MREIKFRGMDVATKSYVYGYYIKDKEHGDMIVDEHTGYRYDVIPESVGQHTGFSTKRGQPIYEGDNVRCRVDSNYLGEYHNNESGYIEGAVEYNPLYGFVIGKPVFVAKGKSMHTSMRCRLLKGRTELVNNK